MGEERPHPAFGVLVLAMSSPGYLAATGVIPSDDSDFGAPRWVVAWIVVATFGYIGLWLLGSGGGPRWAGIAGRVLAPVLASALALHAFDHGFGRTGFVQVAWFGLGLLTALVATHHWKNLVGFLRL
ncbi:MAG: hypothetical protein KJ067_06215 [Vicinamibacteria bacterium]|nr:hypothetical protein [Vicinamibacteria bacterium]